MIELTPPLQSPSVIGHDEAKTQFESAFDAGRMPHAWLITGPEGIGKMTFAVHGARMLLSGGRIRLTKPDTAHSAAKLVASGAHPDLFVLERTADEKTGILRKTVSVEDARKVAPFLRLTPAFGGARVALVDEAHKLTTAAQNALLKIIEEPPKDSYILMAATTAAALVPTIRSRCRILSLAPLTDNQLDVVLSRQGAELPQGPAKTKFLKSAAGSAGFALALLNNEDALGVFETLLRILLDPITVVAAIHTLAQNVGGKGEEETYAIVARLLDDALRAAAKAAALGQSDELGLAARLAPLDKILDLWEKTANTLASAQNANLDRKLVFIDAVLEIKRRAG